MTPRPYTPTERAAWLPVIARFINAASQGAPAVAAALAESKPDLDQALAVACDATQADVDALDPEHYLDALSTLMQCNAQAIFAEVQQHGHA